MIYRYYLRDSIDAGLKPAAIVRKSVKQVGSFAILATEEPTGPQRQVLKMDGRQGRDKVPIVFPDDSSVKNIKGSALLRTRTNELVGVLGFASDADSQAIRAKYLAGEFALHVVTQPIEGLELRAGEVFNQVTGPATILTKWEPLQIVLELK